MEAVTETCDQCGFDASRWTRTDAARTLAHAHDLVALAVEGVTDDIWNTRPTPDTWSIAEYTDHLREVLFANHFVCATAVERPGTDLGRASPPPARDEPPPLDRAETIAGLAHEGTRFAAMLDGLADDRWTMTAGVGGIPWSVEYSARHACHDLMHHLEDIARIRHDLGDTLGPLHGTVAQLSTSDGGVPKRPVDRGRVGIGGLEGDRQATRRHHGRPWQAMCLYSADVIDALAEEGHPIEYGSTGENLTLAGIDWALLRAGLVITVGDLRMRLSAPATPCAKNSRFFAGRDHLRMDHDRHPGWSRWYASVLSPGAVAPGDAVTVSSR